VDPTASQQLCQSFQQTRYAASSWPSLALAVFDSIFSCTVVLLHEAIRILTMAFDGHPAYCR